MAEAAAKGDHVVDQGDRPECAVCLQTCVHPAQLPCGHIFCYLCVKGFANQNKRCAICRQEIPADFIDQPRLLQGAQNLAESFDGGYQWFYEGRNGWWQYDDRTSKELENSYKNEDTSIELLIAGFLYIVDFENMIQLRRNDPSRRRQIKRDFSTICKKGVAGIRTNSSECPIPEVRPVSPTDHQITVVLPATPSNTPQSPTSGRESPNHEQDFQATVELISNLNNLTLNCRETSDHGNSGEEE